MGPGARGCRPAVKHLGNSELVFSFPRGSSDRPPRSWCDPGPPPAGLTQVLPDSGPRRRGLAACRVCLLARRAPLSFVGMCFNTVSQEPLPPPSLPPFARCCEGASPSVPTRGQAGVWPRRRLPFAQERRGPPRGIWSLKPRPCPSALRTSGPVVWGNIRLFPSAFPGGAPWGPPAASCLQAG